MRNPTASTDPLADLFEFATNDDPGRLLKGEILVMAQAISVADLNRLILDLNAHLEPMKKRVYFRKEVMHLLSQEVRRRAERLERVVATDRQLDEEDFFDDAPRD